MDFSNVSNRCIPNLPTNHIITQSCKPRTKFNDIYTCILRKELTKAVTKQAVRLTEMKIILVHL